MFRICFISLILFLFSSQSIFANGIIVNEASNGTSGAREFYELLVVGSASNPTGAVDLDGWIVDDNNGDWEGTTTGVGIAPGYLRFDATSDVANCASLSSMTPGSIIVVYNALDPNNNLPPDDSTDSNGDGVFVLPAQGSCMTTCNGPPSSSNSGYASCVVPAATPSYSRVALRNGGDVAQTRDPSATLFHGFAYGDITLPYPPGSFNVSTSSGSSSTFVFSCGSWFDGGNFSRESAAGDTPGAVNNTENGILRDRIIAGTFDYGNLSNPLNCSGGDSSVNVIKSVKVWDPSNSGLYAVPGNDVVYSILITNTGGTALDEDSIFLVDAMPSEVSFYNDDFDDGGPETDPIIDVNSNSGLTLTFGLDIGFSNGSTPPVDLDDCDYTPAAGYDSDVRFICINPKGSMVAGTPNPSIEFKFRSRIL